jgi:hypothetical protein
MARALPRLVLGLYYVEQLHASSSTEQRKYISGVSSTTCVPDINSMSESLSPSALTKAFQVACTSAGTIKNTSIGIVRSVPHPDGSLGVAAMSPAPHLSSTSKNTSTLPTCRTRHALPLALCRKRPHTSNAGHSARAPRDAGARPQDAGWPIYKLEYRPPSASRSTSVH